MLSPAVQVSGQGLISCSTEDKPYLDWLSAAVVCLNTGQHILYQAPSVLGLWFGQDSLKVADWDANCVCTPVAYLHECLALAPHALRSQVGTARGLFLPPGVLAVSPSFQSRESHPVRSWDRSKQVCTSLIPSWWCLVAPGQSVLLAVLVFFHAGSTCDDGDMRPGHTGWAV